MPDKLFTKPVAMITFSGSDEMLEGYAIVEQPCLISVDSVSFIEGRHSSESEDYLSGRRVLIPTANVTTITEFDSLNEICWEDDEDDRPQHPAFDL